MEISAKLLRNFGATLIHLGEKGGKKVAKLSFSQTPTTAAVEALSRQLNAVIEVVCSHEQSDIGVLQKFDEDAGEFLNTCLQRALRARASDIHFEAMPLECKIRIRIDGVMQDFGVVKRGDYEGLLSVIKLTSSIDIAQKLLPQDGRFSGEFDGEEFDFRTSTLPNIHGENAVIRILKKNQTALSLEKLGFNEEFLRSFKECSQKPNSLMLLCGPTGSGKTTTLYAALKNIWQSGKKFISVEDPVEYNLENVTQTQLNQKAGLDFEVALRAILRQDPDVVMIGEIRDTQTLQTALRAALTGHQVFSSIHANSAAKAVLRMSEMGAANYLLSGALNAIISQRLVRKLCECKRQVGAEFLPNGCKKCFFTGYLGRVAVGEILRVTPKVASLIAKGAETEELEAACEGFVSIHQNALKLVEAGVTSREEIRAKI